MSACGKCGNLLVFIFLFFHLGDAWLQPACLLTAQPSRQQRKNQQLSASIMNNDDFLCFSRREAIFGAVCAASACVTLPSFAEDVVAPEVKPAGQLVSTEKVAALLRAVPTFSIVDERGVPYMVVGEDAKVTCYFFTDYTEAKRILSAARRSADKAIKQAKKDPEQSSEDLTNPWLEARISTVPLDFAATLVSRTMFGGGIRRSGGNYFQVASSQKDIEDALAITGKEDLTEGKVPLFYMEHFEFRNGDTPLYFSRGQLEKAFRKENPGEKLPEVKVSELFAVLLEMVRPDGTDTDLQKLVFVPLPESLTKAKQCQKEGGKASPFVVGERNIIL